MPNIPGKPQKFRRPLKRPRAPAGMETDPETGEVRVNDKTKGLEKLNIDVSDNWQEAPDPVDVDWEKKFDLEVYNGPPDLIQQFYMDAEGEKVVIRQADWATEPDIWVIMFPFNRKRAIKIKQISDLWDEIERYQGVNLTMGDAKIYIKGDRVGEFRSLLQGSGRRRPVQAQLIFKVTFPNYQQMDYSSRPYFTHNWYQTMREHVAGYGGNFDVDDSGQQFLTAIFRNQTAAHRFAKSLVDDYYISPTRISGAIEKMAAMDDAASIAQRLPGVASDPQVQEALQSAFSLYHVKYPKTQPDNTQWVYPALQQDPNIRQMLLQAVQAAEARNDHSGRALSFDPRSYYKEPDAIQRFFGQASIEDDWL